MKTILLIPVFIIVTNIAHSQQDYSLTISGEAGIPTGAFGDISDMGFGGSVKVGFPAGKNGQITFGFSYTSFKLKEIGTIKGRLAVLPFMLGYRHFIKSFYLEQQLGFGIYSSNASSGFSTGNNKTAFTWASGIGYLVGKVNIGLRYQSGKLKYNTEPFSLVGISVGYNFKFTKPVDPEQ